MVTRLVDYVLNLREEDVRELWLEDMACCTAWWRAWSRTGQDAGARSRIANVIDLWKSSVTLREYATEGRHQQPLLRQLLDETAAKGADSLDEDAISFLMAAYELAADSHDSILFERPRRLLEPHIAALESLWKQMTGNAELESLSERVVIVPGPDLGLAKHREIKVMAGIEVGCVAPVFAHTGHLKVLGNVPENCVVVVEQGSCYIGGYLLGRVAVTRDCEVFDNISGMAIARMGSIRSRNIIDGAFVVAKGGAVLCRGTQRPKLVYGGNRISVSGKTLAGRYVSPHVRVDGEVSGGEFATCGAIRAEWFRPSETRPLTIALKEELSGRDFGEVTSPEAQVLIQRGNALRYRLRRLAAAAEWYEQEADEAAANALLSLCGGESAHERIEELAAMERRLAFLRRIIAGIDALSASSDAGEEDARIIHQYASDVEAMTSEGAGDSDLVSQHDEIMRTWKSLQEKERDTGLTSTMLMRLRERLTEWAREKENLTQRVAAAQADLRGLLDGTGLLRATTARRGKVQLLKRLVSTAKSKGTNDALSRRLDSGFVRLIFRTIRTRLERADACLKDAEALREKLHELAETLRKEYQVNIPEDGASRAHPYVTGRFHHGVRIMAEASDGGRHGPLHALETPDSYGEVRTYVWQEAGLVELRGEPAPS